MQRESVSESGKSVSVTREFRRVGQNATFRKSLTTHSTQESLVGAEPEYVRNTGYTITLRPVVYGRRQTSLNIICSAHNTQMWSRYLGHRRIWLKARHIKSQIINPFLRQLDRKEDACDDWRYSQRNECTDRNSQYADTPPQLWRSSVD